MNKKHLFSILLLTSSFLYAEEVTPEEPVTEEVVAEETPAESVDVVINNVDEWIATAPGIVINRSKDKKIDFQNLTEEQDAILCKDTSRFKKAAEEAGHIVKEVKFRHREYFLISTNCLYCLLNLFCPWIILIFFDFLNLLKKY